MRQNVAMSSDRYTVVHEQKGLLPDKPKKLDFVQFSKLIKEENLLELCLTKTLTKLTSILL